MLIQIIIAYAKAFPVWAPRPSELAARLCRARASSQASLHLTYVRFGFAVEAIQGDHVREGNGVLVIGGGPAGLAAAIAARKKGFDVTVVDGAKPPIDKACGEGLMPNTVAALRELGIAIDPRDGRIFRGLRFIEGKTEAEGNFPGEGGI